MQIAQVAPLVESVPPRLYGGTERVVATLTNALVQRGHNVTLFASGDSQTEATLVPVVPEALRLTGVLDATPAHTLALGMVCARAEEFDVIHSHLDYLALPLSRLLRRPVLHTLHGRLDLPEIQPVFRHYQDAALVSISDNQRRLLTNWPWAGTVYHGIDLDAYSLHPNPGEYLAFLGRISPEKGLPAAIRVAQLTGLPLKIAAKIDPSNRDYYENEVKPLLDHARIEYVGEITDREKDDFLGRALALLFPICWPEPFGLVMVEAMATGCPVLAHRCGSVPEIVEDGVTGFLCDSVEEMALACSRLGEIRREACRARVERYFNADRMAERYEEVYGQLLQPNAAPGPVAPFVLSRNGHHAPV
jgi:glycosyltransferase involved in cell wall biosynthesis